MNPPPPPPPPISVKRYTPYLGIGYHSQIYQLEKHPFPGLSREIFPRLHPQNTSPPPHFPRKYENACAPPPPLIHSTVGEGVGHRYVIILLIIKHTCVKRGKCDEIAKGNFFLKNHSSIHSLSMSGYATTDWLLSVANWSEPWRRAVISLHFSPFYIQVKFCLCLINYKDS